MDGKGQHRGSRNSDGNVPNVYCNSDNRKLYINWYNPDNSNDNMRARAEVSKDKRDSKPISFVVYIFPSQPTFLIFPEASLQGRYIFVAQ